MANKITCTCGHSWDKSDSSKKDAYVCHICGKDIKNMQLGGNVYSASYVPQAEEGWLSKYKDGGSMQEHQENYNDSSVSMGPGFVGMGNNTKGRNYSPAWGGQFEDGGYIPKAQKGIVSEDTEAGASYEKEGAPSRLPNIKSTFASYIKSPLYKKRLEGMNVADPDKVINERLSKLNQVDVSVGPSPSLIYSYTKPNQKEQIPALTVKQKDSDYTMMHELSHVTNYGDTFFDPKINKYAKSNFGDVNTASGKGMSVNEMLYITNRANMLPKYKNAILAKAESNKKWGNYSNPADGSGLAGDPHAFDPSELKSDLDAIRLLFQREKLTKKFGEDIDESTIEKALKNKNISNEPHFQRMLKNFNKKNIVDLNNLIAMNNLRENASNDIAEYGADIPQAQNGLWSTNKRAYVDSSLNANKDIEWVKRFYESNPKAVMVPGEKYPSTHLIGDNDQGYVFPRIVNMNGQLVDLGDGAEDYARETNTGIQFPKEQGTWFARSTGDDSGYKMGTGVLKGKPVMQKYKSADKKAMGGSIPGAVGFTYARTINPAPSNGPYAKKTKASAQKGGDIKKDDMGYWNPDNWGKPVEIGSNDITMQGVNQPLIGISDEGDTQMMYPGEDYKFKGKKVTEYPVSKKWLDKYK